jgi:hypothetical protein
LNIYFINGCFLGVKVEFPQEVVGVETLLTRVLVIICRSLVASWCCGGV